MPRRLWSCWKMCLVRASREPIRGRFRSVWSTLPRREDERACIAVVGNTELRLSGRGWSRIPLRSCGRVPSSQRNTESASKIGMVGVFVAAETGPAGGRGVSKPRSLGDVSKQRMAQTSCDAYSAFEVSWCRQRCEQHGTSQFVYLTLSSRGALSANVSIRSITEDNTLGDLSVGCCSA